MRLLVLVCGLACVAFAAPKARAQAPEVAVTVTPEFTQVRPGSSLLVAVRLRVPDGWRIGWINPGPNGSPTALRWSSEGGIRAGKPAWPFPDLDTSGATIAHVYRGDVVILTPIRVAPSVPVGTVQVRGTLGWGLCRELCVGQERPVTVSFTVDTSAAEPSPAWADMAAAGAATVPVTVGQSFVRAAFTRDSVRLTISRLLGGPPPGSDVTFFPTEARHPAVLARARLAPGGFAVVLPLDARDGVGRIAGVLVASVPWGPDPGHRALAFDAHVHGASSR